MEMKRENGVGYRAQPGWYAFNFDITTSTLQHQIIKWLYDTVEDCEENVMWFGISPCFYVRFKREKDLLIFLLTWSSYGNIGPREPM